MSINQISINGFQGISNEIKISLDKQSLLILGDNGTGKSSIDQALRWCLLNEKPPPHDGFTKKESFKRNIKLNLSEEPSVEILLTNGGKIFVKGHEEDINENGKDFRDNCIKGNPFLKRSDILNVLEAIPADLFRYLENFLDLDIIDSLMENFKETLSEHKEEISQQETNHLILTQPIALSIPENYRPDKFTLSTIVHGCYESSKKYNLVDKEEESEKLLFEIIKPKIMEYLEEGKLKKLHTQIENLRTNITNFIKEEKIDSLPDLLKIYSDKEKLAKIAIDSDIRTLLIHAQDHLSSKEVKSCPVCKQKINRVEVLGEIKKRLDNLSEFSDISDSLSEGLSQWHQVIIKFIPILNEAVTILGKTDISELSKDYIVPKSFDLITEIEDLNHDRLLRHLLIIKNEDLKTWILEISSVINGNLLKLSQDLPDLDDLGALTLLLEAINNLEIKIGEIKSAEKELGFKENVYEIMFLIAEKIRKARQDVVKELLNSISENLSHYYNFIHPPERDDEETGAPLIKIQRHAGGTAFITGKFAELEIPDLRWVYSDGHLDTVGICVFLALRKFRALQKEDPKLIVLDDVILSIDHKHSRRFIDLLKKEFKNHQIIIFTHNRTFATWFNRKMNVRNLEIKGWSLRGGVQIGDYLTHFEKLEKSLKSGDAEDIAVSVFRLFDEWLVDCRYIYSLSIPAKRDERYTITDLWNGLRSRFKKMNKNGKVNLDSRLDLMNELEDNPDFRNALAAHFRPDSGDIPRATIVEVASQLKSLISEFYCLECYEFAAPNPDYRTPDKLKCNCTEGGILIDDK